MRLDFAAFSNLGPRASNEDRYLEPHAGYQSGSLVAIADGIGGAPGGAEAATMAIEAAKIIGADPKTLNTIFTKAVSDIQDFVKREPEKARMGTTLSVASINDGLAHVAHVGDTRIYHLRGRGLNNLTEDQTEIAELVRKGVFNEAQARRYPRRNVLTSALTAKGEYEVLHSQAQLEIGDRLLLLSDGVYHHIKRGGILNASLTNQRVSDFVHEIERRVIDKGPSDNFTALAVEVLGI